MEQRRKAVYPREDTLVRRDAHSSPSVSWGASVRTSFKCEVSLRRRAWSRSYTSRDNTGGRGHLHYKLRVVFTGPYGDEYEHVTEAKDPHHFETLEVGDVIELVYDPQDPSRAALPRQLAQPWWLAALVVGGLGLPMMGLGCWILLRQRIAAAN